MQRTKKRNKAALVLPGALGGKWDPCGLHWALPESQAEGGWRYGEQMAVAVPS